MERTPDSPGSADPRRWPLPPILLAAALLAVGPVYWRVVGLPFVQDDWDRLYHCRSDGLVALLQTILSTEHKLFYRPLAELYLLVMYGLFGADPVPFHLVALALHCGSAVLLGLIVQRLFGDRLLALLSTLVYGAAIAVHLDSLVWAVGIYDVAGAFCLLASIWLFTAGRRGASAAVYAVGCLFKESLILLPVILLAYDLLIDARERTPRPLRTRLTEALPFLVCLLTIAALKLSGESPLQHPASHPYALALTGPHLLTNGLHYLTWLLQSFIPVPIPTQGLASLLPVVPMLALLGLAFGLRGAGDPSRHRRRVMFLLVWMVIGLVPVIFLPNHVYRYYATYSLAAWVPFVLYLARETLRALRVGRTASTMLLLAIGATALLGSGRQADRIYREGTTPRTFVDGTNLLIERAAYVDIVRGGLARLLPHPPRNAAIVIGNVDIWGFDRNRGPRFWYDDPSLNVYPLAKLRFRGDRLYIADLEVTQADAYTGGSHSLIRLDPRRTFFFQVTNGALEALTAADLARLRASPDRQLPSEP